MTSAQALLTPTHRSPRAAAAYQALLPEIWAVTEESIPPILIDIPTAVTTVLGALPQIRALRPEIAETFRKFDVAEFDRLEQYTLALSHTHALHRAAHGPRLSLRAIAGELVRLRDMLLSDARSLAGHRLISAERLAGCRARPGYRALAYDVLTLVQVLPEWRGCSACCSVGAGLRLPKLEQGGGRHRFGAALAPELLQNRWTARSATCPDRRGSDGAPSSSRAPAIRPGTPEAAKRRRCGAAGGGCGPEDSIGRPLGDGRGFRSHPPTHRRHRKRTGRF